MDFFIKETNVRGGNRGGKNLFNWDDVRLLTNRDRQSYLGSTQALGLMDRGGKWYRRDWWTHYDSQVNVYGHKDKLNNRAALLDEQKEIRKKEKEKLYEFIYGKKKKNTNIGIINFNDNESLKTEIIKKEIGNNLNSNTKSEYGEMSRPGLGMKTPIPMTPMSSKDTEIIFDKVNKKEKEEESFIGKKRKSSDNYNYNKKKNEEDNDKNSKKHSHHHHHYHHKHHHDRSKKLLKNNKNYKEDL